MKLYIERNNLIEMFTDWDRRALHNDKHRWIVLFFILLLDQRWFIKLHYMNIILTYIFTFFIRAGWQPANIFMKKMNGIVYGYNDVPFYGYNNHSFIECDYMF